MIPREKGVAPGNEDDGVVVFTATDGVKDESYLVVVNAKDLTLTLTLTLNLTLALTLNLNLSWSTPKDFKETASQRLPERITFSTHGEWFEGLLQ